MIHALRVTSLLVLCAGALATCSRAGPPAATGTTSPTNELTYYKDVKPIVDAKCATCHTQGGIAPFALTSASDVLQNATLMKAAVSAGIMPPWPPNASCNSYLRDRSLSDTEKTTLLTWLGGSQALGNPSDAPAETPPSTGLSRVDFTLTMPVPYTPQKSPDEYRCFLLDWPEATTTYVTGFGVQPGDAQIVHHVIAYLAGPDQVATYQAMDGKDGLPGWECFGGPGGNEQDFGWLGAWAPGTLGSDNPPGTGVQVVGGSKVILQVHYNTLVNKPAPDQTSVKIAVAPSVEKQAFVAPFTNPDWVLSHTMNIPANNPDVSYGFSADVTGYLSYLSHGVYMDNKPFTVWGSALHMHTRGSHANVSIQRADSSTSCLVDIPQWNFNWQGMYGLQQPVTVNPGDQISLECHWDNSQANQPVVNGMQIPSHDLNWGETTEDEMCLAILYVTQ